MQGVQKGGSKEELRIPRVSRTRNGNLSLRDDREIHPGPTTGEETMPARMTPTAFARGYLNAAICGAGFFAVWWAVARGIAWAFHLPRTESFIFAFVVLWGLIFVQFVGSWLGGFRAG